MMRVAGVFYPAEMVDVAKCLLKRVASTWINRKEGRGTKYAHLNLALEQALKEEYLLDNEDAQGRSKLMRLQFNTNLEKHISEFHDFMELGGLHPGDG